MRMHGTRYDYCHACGEPLYGDNYGTDEDPLCPLCSAGRRLAEMRRQGFTAEQITALQRVWVRETDRRYAEMLQEGK